MTFFLNLLVERAVIRTLTPLDYDEMKKHRWGFMASRSVVVDPINSDLNIERWTLLSIQS